MKRALKLWMLALACGLAVALLFAVSATATNVKYKRLNGDVSQVVDDPACADQSIAQGVAKNVLVYCTKAAQIQQPTVLSCAPLAQINADVQANYDAPGLSFKAPNFGRGQAYVMAFRTGAASPSQNLASLQEYTGDPVTKRAVISLSPCDFGSVGGGSAGSTTQLVFTVGVPVPGMQVLQPNTQYFLNVKNEDPRRPGDDSCPDACGFVLNFYR